MEGEAGWEPTGKESIDKAIPCAALQGKEAFKRSWDRERCGKQGCHGDESH